MNEVLAKLRPLLPFSACALAASCLAFLLTRPLDYTTAFLLMTMVFAMTFPLLVRYSYQMFILSLLMPVSMFFLKGSPPIWMVMLVLCLGMSVIERAISGKSRYIYVPQIVLPLLALTVVVFVTAELTGGLGFKALGGNVYGGKKYVVMFAGVLAFFAITSRPIPSDKAWLYASLFLLGGLPSFIADLAGVLPSSLHFIFLVVPPTEAGVDELGNYNNFVLGVSRMGGTSTSAIGIFLWLLASHGVRETFQIRRPWRWLGLGVTLMLVGLGGFRNLIMLGLIVFTLLFFLEKQHRTPLAMFLLLLGILAAAMVVPFAAKLPFVMQRSLAFLPLSLSPEAVASAQDSSNWRIEMWTSLLPEIPGHLLLGKGYAISTETYNEMVSAFMGQKQIDSSQQSLALSGDYHNGPISVVLSFGIWGCFAFIWFVSSALWALWRNYKYGDPALAKLNRFLFVIFVGKLIIFLTVFGDLSGDLVNFATYVGLSIAINHGICRRATNHQLARAQIPHLIRYKRPLPSTTPAPWSSAHLL